MNNLPEKFWPFSPKLAIVVGLFILVAGSVVLALSAIYLKWPPTPVQRTLVWALLIIAAAPLVLASLDVLAVKGASLEVKGLKVDFAQAASQSAAFSVPANIGVRGQAVTDSSTTEIMDTLRSAASSKLIVIDLEDGDAWWETRLLVLISGGARLGTPEIVVFVATESGRQNIFQGWGKTASMLPYLLDADSQYQQIHQHTQSTAAQWALLPQPVSRHLAGAPSPIILTDLASNYAWMADDERDSSRHNPFANEQLLQSELGSNIEGQGQTRAVTVSRLREVFAPVLNVEVVDQAWDPATQSEAFLATDAEYVALTKSDKYVGLLSRTAILNSAVRDLMSRSARA